MLWDGGGGGGGLVTTEWRGPLCWWPKGIASSSSSSHDECGHALSRLYLRSAGPDSSIHNTGSVQLSARKQGLIIAHWTKRILALLTRLRHKISRICQRYYLLKLFWQFTVLTTDDFVPIFIKSVCLQTTAQKHVRHVGCAVNKSQSISSSSDLHANAYAKFNRLNNMRQNNHTKIAKVFDCYLRRLSYKNWDRPCAHQMFQPMTWKATKPYTIISNKTNRFHQKFGSEWLKPSYL